MLLDLVQNMAILIALCSIYVILSRFRGRNLMLWKLATGVWFGSVAVLGMMLPFVYEPGVIYDGRSIVLALAGLFGGGYASLAAMLIAGGFRIFLGGAGVYAGLATIVFCTLVGLGFRRLYRNQPEKIGLAVLFLIGIAVHMVMLACQLLIPWPVGLEVFLKLWLPVMVIFPPAFVVMSLILASEDRREIREIEIRGQEARYRKLVESADAIVWEFDPNKNKWTYIAPQVVDTLGWQKEAWSGIDFWIEKIHPDDRENTLRMREEGLKNSGTFSLEYRFRSGNGQYLWLKDVGSEDVTSTGEASLRGMFFDLSERKQIELNLREKGDFIQTVLDHLPIGVALNRIDDGTAISMNGRFSEIYGWDASLLTDVEQFFVRVFPDPVYRTGIQNRIMSDIQSGDPSRMYWEEIRIIRSDGSTGYVNAVNIPLFDQNIMVSTVLDITEQVIAEHALRESEEKFRKLFEDHSAVQMLVDPETGRIENANQAAADYYGWSIKQLKSMSVYQINTLPRDEINKAMSATAERRRSFFEFRHRKANGEVRDVELHGSRIAVQGKVLLHSIIHDITEKKQLYLDIMAAKEKAEENDRLKSAFLANMSHEIRTPLNGILGFTELLTDEDDLESGSRKKYYEIIQRSAESLTQIIDDILDISKLETGQLPIVITRFNLHESLELLYRIFTRKLEGQGKRDLTLHLLKAPHDLFIETDRNRFQQILTNLLDNSVKFTEKGAVTFGFKGFENGYIQFTVTDTGIGIPEDKLELVFDRFTQAGHDIAARYGGTGLGLSIVKKLVTILGGSISIHSRLGDGSQVVFNLPALKINQTDQDSSQVQSEKMVH